MRTETTHGSLCRSDVPRLLLAVVARTILWTILMLVAWSVVPAALGWQVTTVVSGSMAPAIRVGDVVAVMPVDDDAIATGRVLLVDDPDHSERLRLHRVDRVLADGTYRLRGDANAEPDRSVVTPDAVHGVGVLRFPGIGLPSTWIREGAWSSLVGAVAALAFLAMLARADRRILTGAPCERCGTPRWGLGDTVSDVRTTRVPLLTVSASALLVALVATSGVSASFTGSTTTASALGTTASFPCFRGPLDGALLAWDFDEKDGTTVLDRSGHGQDALMTPHATRTDGSCSTNPSLTLADAPDDPRVLSTSMIPGPTTFSTEVWFRTDVPQGSITSFGSEHSPASAVKDRRLYVDSTGHLRFGVQGSGGFAFTTPSQSTVTDGEWHHAVGTSRPGRMELWVDGVLQSARTDNASPRRFDGYWRVGRESLGGWANESAPNFVGDVDTVRVHDRILDAATIQAHAAAGR